MKVDYHMHTTRCGHAIGTMDEYVKQAIKLGFPEIGFSDHLPLSPAPEGTWSCDWAMQEKELPEYREEIVKLQTKYPQITIKSGIEADYFPESIEKTKILLASYQWDYVLGSVHHIGPWPIDSSVYLDEFDKRDLYKTYETYFSLVSAAAQTGLFDIMAHLDVIKKYGHRPSEDLSSLYNDLALELKKANVAAELNTSGFRKVAAEIYPAPPLIRKLVEAGVPLTLGSDSHSPTEVGMDFDKAIELLNKFGVREIATFTARKRQMVPLK